MKKKVILIACLIIVIIAIVVAYFVLNKNDENTGATENNVQASPTPITNVEAMTEQEKSIFNSNFDMYLGKEVTAKKVKSLIATIKNSNENTQIRKVTLLINGEESMDTSKINASSTYDVSFEYDEQGLICTAIVKEN